MAHQWHKKLTTLFPGTLAYLLYAILYANYRSIRWQVVDNGGYHYITQSGKNAILVAWHCQIMGIGLFTNLFASPKIKLHYMASPSHDSAFAAKITQHLGLSAITGSSDKKPVEAYRAALRHLKDGKNFYINPDGPRGPARIAKMGAIHLAKMSGVPIIPVAYASRPMIRLNSWDRMWVGIFFGKGVIYWGQPVYIAKTASRDDLEQARALIEHRLNTLTDEAEATVRPPNPS